ncbi:MAG: hypothetical protein GX797_10335 [Chloroflexi bacterium]|nr:hypothetical protein [Chloroflexota bacterium]
MITEGSVYKLKGSEDKPHYHIIVFSDPRGQGKQYIVCYLSSTTTRADTTTTFKPGDEFFITKPCWVKYRNAKIIVEMDFEKLTSIGVISDQNLEKIKEGFKLSLGKMPGEVKNLWKQWEQDRWFPPSL